MALYAVIDKNVLVSAFLKPDSVPRLVIDHVFSGDVVPVYNDEIISEYNGVLIRPKFHFPKEAITVVVSEMKKIGLCVQPTEITDSLPDPKDVVFYAVTMNARTEMDAFLMTGNLKHFPEKPFVVTPRKMLDIIERSLL